MLPGLSSSYGTEAYTDEQRDPLGANVYQTDGTVDFKTGEIIDYNTDIYR